MFKLTGLPHGSLPQKYRKAAPSFRLWSSPQRNAGAIAIVNHQPPGSIATPPPSPVWAADYFSISTEQAIDAISTNLQADSVGLNSYWQSEDGSALNIIAAEATAIELRVAAINSAFIEIADGSVTDVTVAGTTVNFSQVGSRLTVDAPLATPLKIFRRIETNTLLPFARVLAFELDLDTLEAAEWMGKTYAPIADINYPQQFEFVFTGGLALLFSDSFSLELPDFAKTEGLSRIGKIST